MTEHVQFDEVKKYIGKYLLLNAQFIPFLKLQFKNIEMKRLRISIFWHVFFWFPFIFLEFGYTI